jgi:type VI secretion system protein ImpE
MDPKKLIKEGKLAEARALLTDAVKSSPGDVASRTLLFQVLSFCGEFEKARRHLETIAVQDAARAAGVQVYLNLVQAETERQAVWRQQQTCTFLPEKPAYAGQYETAWRMLAEQKLDDARKALEQIGAEQPPVTGTLNGESIDGFSDTDPRLFCFLEAFVHERYVLVPIEAVREILVQAPGTLFDLLWTSARITTWDGLTLNCYLPVLYPQSCDHEDDRIKLGRMTDWISLGGGLFKGAGQHVFQAGERDIGILEIREAVFNPPVKEH